MCNVGRDGERLHFINISRTEILQEDLVFVGNVSDNDVTKKLNEHKSRYTTICDFYYGWFIKFVC